MKLRRLWIDRFKNLRNCEVTFKQPSLLSAVIGENGSGKSNLVEALLQILVDVYFEKPSLFDFDFEYEAQGRDVRLSACNRKLKCEIDGQDMPIGHFARRLRDGDAQ
ncbi:MAG: AAA family ATPase, partial [bacterium]|nr:AAA family ATPase [bacterium]